MIINVFKCIVFIFNMKKRGPTSLRIPEEIFSLLQEDSKKEERSIGGQIIFILKKHYGDKLK